MRGFRICAIFILTLLATARLPLFADGGKEKPRPADKKTLQRKKAEQKHRATVQKYLRPDPEPSPFELPQSVPIRSALDRRLSLYWQQGGESLPHQAADAVFLRRASLKLTGKLPTIDEVNAFLADRNPDKREKLVDQLLSSQEFARLTAMRLADMLRIKSEFPINLWPNAVQSYHRYLYTSVIANRSWFTMVREMLTASGSNFRVPAANFCRAAASHTPEGLGKAAALSLLGWRWERLTPLEQQNFAMFFSRVRFKKTSEWKEEIVYTDPVPAVVSAALPGGKMQLIRSPGEDPRERLALLLTAPGSQQLLARAMASRAWFWMTGESLTPLADDLPVPGSAKPLSEEEKERLNPARRQILEQLTNDFMESRGSFRRLFREIALSAAFQASPLPAGATARYRPHRIEAEVLADMLAQTLGYRERYMSVIPEPFTFLPPEEGAVGIADGSITGPLIAVFGRPSRDEGYLSERNALSTSAQRLFLMNSGPLYNSIRGSSWRIRTVRKLKNDTQHVDAVYRLFLSRPPLRLEQWYFQQYRSRLPDNARRDVWNDLVWTIINSKEFLYHH